MTVFFNLLMLYHLLLVKQIDSLFCILKSPSDKRLSRQKDVYEIRIERVNDNTIDVQKMAECTKRWWSVQKMVDCTKDGGVYKIWWSVQKMVSNLLQI